MSFAKFNVESQIFFRSPGGLSFGLVNLKPIVPGHVLVCPTRVVPRIADLRADEVSDLFLSVQRVAGILVRRVLGKAFQSQGTTISLQDGPVAGQSVPHVHVHILPRKGGDLAKNDDIYASIDHDSAEMQRDWQAVVDGRPKFTAVDDDERRPRTLEQMEQEARWLATFFQA